MSRQGSIDWLCWPRFDSPSTFAELLDPGKGGRFVIQPTGGFTSTRRYVGETNVLETTFRTGQGVVRLTDFMPAAAERDKQSDLWPDHQILRLLDGLEGRVELTVSCEPRPDFGRSAERFADRGSQGFFLGDRRSMLVLRSDLSLALTDAKRRAGGTVTLAAGERRTLSLAFAHQEPAVLSGPGKDAEDALTRTLAWWEGWAGRCRYRGPYRGPVIRSALTLKLLAYAPSGAVVAAPTTSLPERIGGVRNWDYRYCWLRDASLTLGALHDLGYSAEAIAFLEWLLDSTRLTWPELQVVYDVHGETRLHERELDGLQGYAGSRPVRVGNAARKQFQLDTYGEVVDAAFEFARRGGRLGRAAARMLRGLGRTVCRRWEEPDEGIWEVRGGRLHHTYSKVMCWVALDRLVKLHEAGVLKVPLDRFAQVRDAIRDAVERRGYNDRLGSYTRIFDGDDVDASLLLLARYGFVEAGSPRMQGTFRRIHQALERNGLLFRYQADDGLPPGEGAFGLCSFWAIECLAQQGLRDEATRRFERMLTLANDVGLFGEEIDPGTGAALGNFPQAFTHVGLIDAALALGEARP